jgi:hypothetical protein
VHKYGPEILTAVVGYIGVHLLNTGSSRYGDLRESMNDEDRDAIVRDASAKILGGAGALATVAFTAGNPLFAYPEVATLLTALRPYLDSRSPAVARISQKCRADLLLAGMAVAIGGITVATQVNDAGDLLPPLGLTAISVALAIGGKKTAEKIYRALMIFGGAVMVAGSSVALHEAIQQRNGVGAVMATVFLALNALFTYSEVRNATRG